MVPFPSIISTKLFSSSSSPPPSQTLQNLIKLGATPTSASLNLVLSFLLHSQKFHLLLHIFSQISHNSIRKNSETHYLVAAALHKSLNPKSVKDFVSVIKNFDFLPRQRLLNSVMKLLRDSAENPEIVFSLVSQCVRDYGLFPSLNNFLSLLFKFCSQGKVGRAIEVFDVMTSREVGYPADNFVCGSIISALCRAGNPELGLGFYAKMGKNHGFYPNLAIGTAVVDALCKQGRVDEACSLVQRMEDEGIVFDAVLYSCLICGHFEKGDLMAGLRKHRLMVDKGIAPDVVSYTSIIKGFCREGSVEKASGFLNEMEKGGIKPNSITYTILIQGFCKKGKLEEAFCIMRRMEDLRMEVDEFVYSILIDGLCKKGDLDQVFTLLDEMEHKGIKAGTVTYNTVASGLCKVSKTCKADEMLRDFSGDNFTYGILLHGYMNERNMVGVVETRRRLEEAGICLDLVTYNILIKALFMVGKVEDACVLFEEMSKKGMVANLVTYRTMVDCLCKQGMINKALEVFQECLRTSLVSNASCHECIIRWLCKENSFEMAMEVFDDLIKKGLVCVSTIYIELMKAQFQVANEEGILKFLHRIEKLDSDSLSSISTYAVSFLCAKGCLVAAFDAFIFARSRDLSIGRKAYHVLLKSLIRSGNDNVELMICDYIKANGTFEPTVRNILCVYLCKINVNIAMNFLADTNKNDISSSTLMAVFGTLKKEGRVYDAHHRLMEAEANGLPVGVGVYSIVVDMLCKEGYLENALDLCTCMKRIGIRPNCAIYNSIINGLCQQGSLVEAFRIFDALESNGVLPTVITYTTLIGALSREGFLDDATGLFEKMVQKGILPNTRTYNLLIYGYCSFGLVDESLKVLSDLEKSCLQPDAFTISAVVSGCCLKGEMEGALTFFNEFKKRGFYPDFVGFVSLIKGLFTKGRMEEARAILRDMLQCAAVLDLINRAGNVLNVESLGSLLDLACQQGKIQQAIYVLNAVGSVAVSSWRSNNSKRLSQVKKLLESGSLPKALGMGGICPTAPKAPSMVQQYMENNVPVTSHVFSNILNEDNWRNDSENLFGKSLSYDFETYYTIIASLCLKGELQKANSIVREMLPDSAQHG